MFFWNGVFCYATVSAIPLERGEFYLLCHHCLSDSAEDATTGLARVAYREGDVPDLPPEDREHLDEPHPVGRTLKSRGA